ncbi:hypothetical protein CDL12_08639 [Handroanthus impetiginosus]|uniref:Uncharacterized protein n=1 Tax=Handroanthus impetiginosus TaxID=429701 RepID=A0A2G9HMD1_9LAMI|nr:hypothetical protein CDL12_08639 [Handroanthus impetiginosus]
MGQRQQPHLNSYTTCGERSNTKQTPSNPVFFNSTLSPLSLSLSLYPQKFSAVQRDEPSCSFNLFLSLFETVSTAASATLTISMISFVYKSTLNIKKHTQIHIHCLCKNIV